MLIINPHPLEVRIFNLDIDARVAALFGRLVARAAMLDFASAVRNSASPKAR
jgi:hypothetical protein